MMNKQISRRQFIGMTAATAGLFTVVPAYAVSGLGHVAPGDKLNLAFIGVGEGGKGRVNLNIRAWMGTVAKYIPSGYQ